MERARLPLPCSWIHATPAKSEWGTRSLRRVGIVGDAQEGREKNLSLVSLNRQSYESYSDPAIDITKRNKEIATDRKSGTKNLVAERIPRVPRVPHYPKTFLNSNRTDCTLRPQPKQHVFSSVVVFLYMQVWEKQNNRYA